MPEIMLVNPRKRTKKGKKMATKKRRTAAQKRATKRLVAFNKARRSPTKRKSPKRKAPAKRRKTISKAAPSKRLRARRRKNTKRGYFPNPKKRTRKSMVANIVDKQLKPAAIQATGALMLDIGYGYLGGYIPDMLNSGMTKYATKGAIAIGLGVIANMYMKSNTANLLATGAMTMTMHEAMKEAMANFAPQVPLGFYSAAPVYQNDMGMFSPDDGDGFGGNNLGMFSPDTGTGFSPTYQDSEIFDTSDI